MTEQSAPVSCREVRDTLAAFLADELSGSESRRIQQHLDGCPPCGRFLRFEAAFDGALKRTLRREPAPASLMLRIQRALDEEQEGGAGRPRGRTSARPWVRWALAATVLVAFMGPAVVGVRSGYLRLPVTAAGVVYEAEGTLVCAECMRHGRPVSQQRGCRAHGHHTAFRADDGAVWEFVDDASARPLIIDADRIGDRLEVEGLFIDDLHYVRVDAYRYRTAADASQRGL